MGCNRIFPYARAFWVGMAWELLKAPPSPMIDFTSQTVRPPQDGDSLNFQAGGLQCIPGNLSAKIGEGILITTAHLGLHGPKIVYVNRAFTEITGYSEEDAMGKTLQFLHGPRTSRRVIVDLRKALRQGSLWRGETTHYRKDGRELHLDWRIEPLRNPEGEITHFLCIQHDRTKEQEAKKAMVESDAKYRSMFENAVFGIFQTTSDGHYLNANPALAKIYGYDSSDDLMQHLTRIETQLYVKPARRAEFIETLRTAGKVLDFESEVYRKDGSILWISESAREVRDLDSGDLLYYEGMVEDISERKTLESQLLRSQRVESIGMLASGMAHDLANVLSPVLMTASWLKGRHLEKETQKALELVEANVLKATALVRQVVGFARGTEGDHVDLDLGALITELVEMTKRAMPKTVDIRLVWNSSGCLTKGDATQLYQVLLNLMVNARDAMAGEGVISLEISKVNIPEPVNRNLFRISPGSFIRIDVSDTGCGIPPAIIEKIFNPFFTTKEVGKGTGLGLSTVMAIMQTHCGAVDVHSVEGQGTRVSLYLPAI